jgi:hypothetical protein
VTLARTVAVDFNVDAGHESVLVSLLLTIRSSVRSRALQLEVLPLRHQLRVLDRSRPGRVRLARVNRSLWVWLSRVRHD